jgi:hypothetical protein
MNVTIYIPSALDRRLETRAALDGRSVRNVTVELYEEWLMQVGPPGPTMGPSLWRPPRRGPGDGRRSGPR